MANISLDDLMNFSEPQIDFAPIRDSLMQSANRSQQRADQFFSEYDTTFKPLAKQLASEASTALSPSGLEDAARTATANAARQGQVQREATDRRMTSMGVNPNSGRFASAQVGAGLADAGLRVGAANTARQAKRAEGLNLLSSTAGLGMNMVNAGTTLENQANSVNKDLANTALGVYDSGVKARMVAASAMGRQQAGGLSSVGGTGQPIIGGTVFKDNIAAPFGTYWPGGNTFMQGFWDTPLSR